MALDITGIKNENEYYSDYYLSSILESDLKGLLGEWLKAAEETKVKTPYDKIKSLSREYFIIRNKLERKFRNSDLNDYSNKFIPHLFETLEYKFEPKLVELDDKSLLPIVGEVRKSDSAPLLWIIENRVTSNEMEDPLSSILVNGQYKNHEEISGDNKILDLPITDIISKKIFAAKEPPRWIILINLFSVVLIDRTKWNEKRIIRFDLTEILSRKNLDALKVMATLLHKDSTCPTDGMPFLDTLDEQSHKHAFEVSEDLKYAAREAVELLGNEAIYYLREVKRDKIFETDIAPQLTSECLRYLYRLLFVFYIEARPELEYAPINSKEYLLGYSLESLRDLNKYAITTEESLNGYYIDQSLKILFKLIYEGFNFSTDKNEELEFADRGEISNSFSIYPLKSHLFDPERTKLLNKVKFRNSVLLKVIKILSYSRGKKKGNRKNKSIGRISYAQLGINQLGAVYEGLLSYNGFFAETDLFEVKKARDKYDELKNAYFVKEKDLKKYDPETEIVSVKGSFKKYLKGTFIYRLSGRNREKSASYYTPEVLTQSLVKYSLKELLKDKTADDILKIKVCEPALGSGAFLNEAINQLSEAYLTLKQKELGETIEHEKYTYERQRVKMYIADYNVYGVDLNPVAVELAEISLWLNTIYKGSYVPWFGTQLVCGNSLVGARRQVFDSSLLKEGLHKEESWKSNVPDKIKLSEKRPENTVYHFLLPDEGMANYKDKVIKSLAEDNLNKINEWRKEFVKPFSKSDIKLLERLSDTIDKLWLKHVDQLKNLNLRTTDTIEIFGKPIPKEKRRLTTTHAKDKIFNEELYSENVRSSSIFRRLKLVMDYWCALWFWPIEKAELLPSRDEYLFDLQLIIEGNVLEMGGSDELNLFPTTTTKDEAQKLVDEFGFVNVDKLCRENDRLNTVKEIGDRYRFHHWELVYADIFFKKDGFDLILGNPPWVKVTWRKENILSDFEPLFDIKDYSAPQVEKECLTILNTEKRKLEFYYDFIEQNSTKEFINSHSNYPYLINLQSNLYKCFLVKSWELGNNNSIVGLFHEAELLSESVGILKRETYKRLNAFLHIKNTLKLFSDVKDTKKFAYTITNAKPKETIGFYLIANLYHPRTIDLCFESDGSGPTPGIKTEENKWELTGHKNRIIWFSHEDLKLINTLFEESDTNIYETRIMLLHSNEVISTLKKITTFEDKISSLKYDPTVMFDETGAKNKRQIIEELSIPDNIETTIYSSPHIYNSNPLYQNVPLHFRNKQDYVGLDINDLDESFRQRTLYSLGETEFNFGDKINFYRNARRKMVFPDAERTLATAIIPPKSKHVNSIISWKFDNYDHLINVTGLTNSLLFDFIVKMVGKQNIYDETINMLPYSNKLPIELKLRTLLLNCVTKDYTELWEECYDKEFNKDSFTQNHSCLSSFSNLTEKWEYNTPLRNFYERRLALVEIDVLVAMEFGITLNELKTIYKLQFSRLYQNEKEIHYDQKGNIVHSHMYLKGIGIKGKDWEKIKDMKDGTVEQLIIDDTMPGEPVERKRIYYAPFFKCNREEDYEIAWKEFEKRLGEN